MLVQLGDSQLKNLALCSMGREGLAHLSAGVKQRGLERLKVAGPESKPVRVACQNKEPEWKEALKDY
jgi:hypothetical protein